VYNVWITFYIKNLKQLFISSCHHKSLFIVQLSIIQHAESECFDCLCTRK